MTTTSQGPGLRRIQKTQVNIQETSFDGDFIRLEGDPVGLAIRQEVFAEWLMVKHYALYISGLNVGKGSVFDWYFATFEEHHTTKKIQKVFKEYIESQTTFQINYE